MQPVLVTAYKSKSGRVFLTEEECVDEDDKSLAGHIIRNIKGTYNDDFHCEIIEDDDVVEYITTHITEINKILGVTQ